MDWIPRNVPLQACCNTHSLSYLLLLGSIKSSCQGCAAYQKTTRDLNGTLGFSLKEGKRTILSMHLRLCSLKRFEPLSIPGATALNFHTLLFL